MQLQDAHLIAVMGATGTGKTTFVNLASGSDFPVGHGMMSGTAEVQQSHEFLLDGKPVILFDTPGFDDSTKTELQILQLLTHFLTELHLNGKKLSGIIFLHRITDERMGGTATKNFRLFRRLCGTDSLKHVFITTNRWSSINEEVGRRREYELATSEQFFKHALDNGARLMRHDETIQSAHLIIRQVLNLSPTLLHIQKELVDEGKGLANTDAGKELDRHLEEQAQRFQDVVYSIQNELRTLKDATSAEIKEIKEERDEAQARVDELRKERDRLKRLQGVAVAALGTSAILAIKAALKLI